MIGTGDGKQYETEFDYLVETAWKGGPTASQEPAGAFSEGGSYPSSGALSSDALTDASDPIKEWSKLAMMKKETFIGGRRVGEGGGGLSKAANSNQDQKAFEANAERIRQSPDYKKIVEERKAEMDKLIKEGKLNPDGSIPVSKYDDAVLNQSWNRLGKDLGRGDPRSSHGIPQGLSADEVNKLKVIRENVLGPAAKPDLKTVPGNPGPAQPGGQVPGVTGYRIWDNVEKKYVSSTYKNELSQRRRARTIAEKKNLEYGAHRYSAKPIFEGEE